MQPSLDRDWQLSDFNNPTIFDGVELCISTDGTKALVIYPWHYTLPDVQPALERAKDMGFTNITEYGNLYPYMVWASDTDDSDFILLEVPE